MLSVRSVYVLRSLQLLLQPEAAREVTAGNGSEKGNKTAKVNVDSKGVIVKGSDAVAYFTQGKPVKGKLKREGWYAWATEYQSIILRIERVRAKGRAARP